MNGIFVTGTSTGVGKTVLTRGLARALWNHDVRVAAIKPVETGCEPEPEDAHALARACHRPELAERPGFYRIAPPLAPYSAHLQFGSPLPSIDDLVSTSLDAARSFELTLVEGAGGLLVPLTRTAAIADLVRALDLPLVVVAPDRLGVISDVLSAAMVARQSRLNVTCVVLSRHSEDLSQSSNLRVLSERLDCPVWPFEAGDLDDDAVAQRIPTGLLDWAMARSVERR